MRIPLKEKAYSCILESILSGELGYNMPIIENDYCEMLQMSRTPIREALKQLEAEGLVYRIADRGGFVKEITITDIMEICELRRMFELEALKYSIDKISQKEIDECRALLNQLDGTVNTELFFRSDKSFHKLILSYCPNRRMMIFYNNIENVSDSGTAGKVKQYNTLWIFYSAGRSGVKRCGLCGKWNESGYVLDIR